MFAGLAEAPSGTGPRRRGAPRGRGAPAPRALPSLLALSGACLLTPRAPGVTWVARCPALVAPRQATTQRRLGVPLLAPAARRHQRRSLGGLAAAFLDDIGSGMRDPALTAELGLSTAEGEEVFERCRSGNMSFGDFVTMTRFLDHVGGDGGMVSTMAQMPDASGSAGMAGKIEGYEEIIEAMGPAEVADPRLLLGRSADARARAGRLAEASGRTKATIDQFLLEYRTLATMLMDLGSGSSMDETTRRMTLLRAEQEAEGKSRKLRRKVRSSTRDRRQPEWMNL